MIRNGIPKIIVILGPTATGKSDLAVELAREFEGEIVSADSRQVYRGLDLGSGKITKREMRGVPHHLLDVCHPKRAYTVEQFKVDAGKAIDDILSRGKLPIVCGGTGFYIDALIFGEEFPAVSPDQTLRTRLARKTPEALMKIIRKLDPRRAKELDPYNKVRIIRAIEVARALGKVPRIKKRKKYDALFIGLKADKETLQKRINDRLAKRIKAGMITEVKRLRESGLSWKRLHSLGLEYRSVALYLQKMMTKAEMVAELQNRIVQFSKRQMTWFKRNPDIKWLSIGEKAKASRLVSSFIS